MATESTQEQGIISFHAFMFFLDSVSIKIMLAWLTGGDSGLQPGNERRNTGVLHLHGRLVNHQS
jgi:hypothetical protein